jgi:hypothetical protein
MKRIIVKILFLIILSSFFLFPGISQTRSIEKNNEDDTGIIYIKFEGEGKETPIKYSEDLSVYLSPYANKRIEWIETTYGTIELEKPEKIGPVRIFGEVEIVSDYDGQPDNLTIKMGHNTKLLFKGNVNLLVNEYPTNDKIIRIDDYTFALRRKIKINYDSSDVLEIGAGKIRVRRGPADKKSQPDDTSMKTKNSVEKGLTINTGNGEISLLDSNDLIVTYDGDNTTELLVLDKCSLIKCGYVFPNTMKVCANELGTLTSCGELGNPKSVDEKTRNSYEESVGFNDDNIKNKLAVYYLNLSTDILKNVALNEEEMKKFNNCTRKSDREDERYNSMNYKDIKTYIDKLGAIQIVKTLTLKEDKVTLRMDSIDDAKKFKYIWIEGRDPGIIKTLSECYFFYYDVALDKKSPHIFRLQGGKWINTDKTDKTLPTIIPSSLDKQVDGAIGKTLALDGKSGTYILLLSGYKGDGIITDIATDYEGKIGMKGGISTGPPSIQGNRPGLGTTPTLALGSPENEAIVNSFFSSFTGYISQGNISGLSGLIEGTYSGNVGGFTSRGSLINAVRDFFLTNNYLTITYNIGSINSTGNEIIFSTTWKAISGTTTETGTTRWWLSNNGKLLHSEGGWFF